MIQGDRGELNKQIRSFLKTHDLAVIATCSKSGQPEAATIGYLVDENFNFFFLTKPDSRKIKNILENPKVALVIGTTSGINTIQVEGEAQIIQQKDVGFEEMLLKTTRIGALYYGPLLKMEGGDFVTVRIKTTWLRFLDFDELNGKEEFFQLIP